MPNIYDGLYPAAPEGFVWEPLANFIPLVVIMNALTLALTLIIGRGHSLFDKFMLFYFVISVFIHLNLERYYTHWNHTILDPNNMDWMARVWRHYGVSDTRWWGQQPGMPRSQISCMYGLEWLAAYECGPLVILTIILYYFKSPWRWAVQSAAVTAQAYGLFITWLPAFYENLSSVPDDPLMFWGYFIGIQSPWMFIPIAAVIQAGWETAKIHARLAKLEKKERRKQKST
ncbi:Emopamil-binding protein [Cladochytrium replicatum]|nr:Emopamil-binding protein [Cladochytrium replicatum]